MSLSRGATALLQLLLGMPSVLQAASKDLHAAEESPGRMPAKTLLRCREWLGGGGDTRLETRANAP